MHYHICRPCGAVWGHTQSPDWSKERFDTEHTCPQCGSTKCCTKWDEIIEKRKLRAHRQS